VSCSRRAGAHDRWRGSGHGALKNAAAPRENRPLCQPRPMNWPYWITARGGLGADKCSDRGGSASGARSSRPAAGDQPPVRGQCGPGFGGLTLRLSVLVFLVEPNSWWAQIRTTPLVRGMAVASDACELDGLRCNPSTSGVLIGLAQGQVAAVVGRDSRPSRSLRIVPPRTKRSG
jgi:hypothetical protein